MRIEPVWNKSRKHVFRLAALLAVLSFLYPGIMTSRNFIFSTGGSLWHFLVALLAVLVGTFTALIIYNKSHLLIRAVLSYFLSVVPAAAAFIYYMDSNIGRAFYEALVIALLHSIGVILYIYDYNIIFGWKIQYTGAGLLFICLLLACLNEKYANMKGVFLAAAYVYILMALVIRTQENLDFIFSRRGVEATEIQKKIRKSNMLTVLVFYLSVLLLFNLKNIVIFILELARKLGGQFIDLVIYILKLLFRNKPSKPYKEPFGFIPFDPVPDWRPVVVLLVSIVVHFAILYAAYKLLPLLFKYFKRLAERFIGFFHRIINGRVDISTPDESECIEIIEVEKALKDKKKGRRNPELYASLDKTTDPAERIRLMYRITISKISGRGVPIASSDTTGEIHEKAGVIGGIGTQFARLTDIYEDVRYGEELPSEEVLVSAQKDYAETQKIMLDRSIKI